MLNVNFNVTLNQNKNMHVFADVKEGILSLSDIRELVD